MNRDLFINTFIASLGGLLIGFNLAVIHETFPFFKDYLGLAQTGEGQAIALTMVGCIFGSLSAGIPSDKFGPREMMKIMALLFIVSSVGTAFSTDYISFAVFRIIAGVAIGGCSVIVPIYLSEIAPHKLRGRTVLAFPLAIAIGFLSDSFFGYQFAEMGANNWRWVFIIMVLPSVLYFLLLFFIFRSPRWTMKKGYDRETTFIIRLMDRSADLDLAMYEITETFRRIAKKKNGKPKIISVRPYSHLLKIVLFFAVFCQMTGISFVINHSSGILTLLNIPSYPVNVQSLITGAFQLTGILVAMSYIDKGGRKAMILPGTIGMVVMLALLGILSLTGLHNNLIQFGLLAGFIFFFYFSQGSLIWVLATEILPNMVRAIGLSIVFSVYWLTGVLAYLFSPFMASFTCDGIVFILYSLVTLAGYFYWRKYLVETKDKSLELLDAEMSEKYCPNLNKKPFYQ